MSQNKIVDKFSLSGEYICSYMNCTDAAQCTHFSRSSISECCAGRRKTCGGFIWRHRQ